MAPDGVVPHTAHPGRTRRSVDSTVWTGVLATAIVASLLIALSPCSAVAAARTASGATTTCDALCAQSTVHHPATATTLAVRWKRYPYAHASDAKAIDAWGSVERQCTGYVTWALNAMHVDFGMQDRKKRHRVVSFLAAGTWATAARHGGWTVSRKPVVGAVAQWDDDETTRWTVHGTTMTFTAGTQGHVGIVSHVYAGGTALIHQYNVGSPTRRYSTMRGKAARYLYIGVR